VAELLQKYQARFKVAPIFTEEEVRHYLVPIPDVIDTYVVEGKGRPFIPITPSMTPFPSAAFQAPSIPHCSTGANPG